jgi:hypothetical protein
MKTGKHGGRGLLAGQRRAAGRDLAAIDGNRAVRIKDRVELRPQVALAHDVVAKVCVGHFELVERNPRPAFILCARPGRESCVAGQAKSGDPNLVFVWVSIKEAVYFRIGSSEIRVPSAIPLMIFCTFTASGA